MSEYDQYIPPPGVIFRLVGLRTNYVLVARKGNINLGNHPSTHQTFYPDQYFTLEDSPTAGQYIIRSVRGGNNPVLYSRQSGKPYSGQTERNDKYDDQRFTFQHGHGLFVGSFRLLAASQNRVIISNFGDKVGNFFADNDHYDDQYFSFEFEDTTLDHIEYDIHKDEVYELPPDIHTVTLRNESSDEDVTMEVDTRRSATEEVSFSHSTGFELSTTEKASFGVPFISEGEISSEQRYISDYTWGTTKSLGLELGSVIQDVHVPPWTSRTVNGYARHGQLDVPATIYSKTKADGVLVVTKTVYKGTQYYDDSYVISEPVRIKKPTKL